MQRRWANGNYRKRALAHFRFFLTAIGSLCSSVIQASRQDSIDVRRVQQKTFVHETVGEHAIACPQFLVVTTFLRQQICVHPCLGEKLAIADTLLKRQGFTEAAQLGIRRMTGFRPGQTSLHGQGAAIDIDAATNPYIIHERNETKLDVDLARVYERIAQFLLGRASVVPSLGVPQHANETRHAYAARMYDALAQESFAMQRYFSLMQNGLQLREYLRSSIGARQARLPATFLSVLVREEKSLLQTPDALSRSVSSAVVDRLRLLMLSDWVTLTGHIGPPVIALDSPSSMRPSQKAYLPYPQILPPIPDDPAKGEVDRPFDPKGEAYPGRSPLKGFLTLRKDLVLTLIDAGLRWGALDFGRTSGDLMHFDSRDMTCNATSNHES